MPASTLIRSTAEPKENVGEGGESIPAAIFKFGDEFRPCQLQKYVDLLEIPSILTCY